MTGYCRITDKVLLLICPSPLNCRIFFLCIGAFAPYLTFTEIGRIRSVLTIVAIQMFIRPAIHFGRCTVPALDRL